jgi:hypothetical protein
MNNDILDYNASLPSPYKEICDLLQKKFDTAFPEGESKLYHRNPAWFLDGNPIVGYSKLKDNLQLLFWSGQSFDEEGLQPEGSFKAAQVRYTSLDQVDTKDLDRWLEKAKTIQWDYKNIVKRRGVLERLK